jgi:hypothetical protein
VSGHVCATIGNEPPACCATWEYAVKYPHRADPDGRGPDSLTDGAWVWTVALAARVSTKRSAHELTGAAP